MAKNAQEANNFEEAVKDQDKLASDDEPTPRPSKRTTIGPSGELVSLPH